MLSNRDFGSVNSVYLSYSSDDSIRFRASSGGFIKSFLWYLVQTYVDYAIITRTGNSNSPLTPETIVTDSSTDILSPRTNSVYAPCNPLSVLKQLNPSEKYALVGLPCHVRTLRLLQSKGQATLLGLPSRIETLRRLQSKGWFNNIIIVISLFCNHVPYIEFTKGILRRLGVKEDDVIQIEYRGHGFPGGFTAYLKDGQKRFIGAVDYWDNDLNNGLEQCKHCSEIGREADICVGDPWNLSIKDDKGQSLVICRSKWATGLVQKAAKAGYIKIQECSFNDLIKSQGYHIEDKLHRGRVYANL